MLSMIKCKLASFFPLARELLVNLQIISTLLCWEDWKKQKMKVKQMNFVSGAVKHLAGKEKKKLESRSQARGVPTAFNNL